MPIRLGLIMTCLLLAACQTQREKFTSIWSSTEVVDDANAYPTDYANMLDNPLGKAHRPAEADAPNKLLTLKDVSGNREYLFTDSISQERGILTVLVEFRYVRPQTLPSNGMTYHYNQWREQIDCKNKVRILRTTTHYNLAGEIVDTIEYPLPKYKPAELAALSQPNDKVIQYVCERAGETGLAVGDAAVATTAKDDGKTSKTGKDKTDKPQTDKTDKTTKSGKNKKEDKIKVDEKIDFISKGKAEAAEQGEKQPADKTDKPQSTTEEATPEFKQTAQPEKKSETNKEKNKKKSKTDKNKKAAPEQTETTKPSPQIINIEIGNDVELLEGEVPLKPMR